MSNDLTEWCALAQITFKGERDAWAVMLPNAHVLLCMDGEASVELTEQEIKSHRTYDGWCMLLISRGMLGDTVSVFATWLVSLSARGPMLVAE